LLFTKLRLMGSSSKFFEAMNKETNPVKNPSDYGLA
jgi:hypothetical protein